MAGFGITKAVPYGKAVANWVKAKLKKEGLKSSKTGAIKSVKPGVGGLYKSRQMFEELQKSSAEGVKKWGRPHTTKVISEQGVKKGFPGLTKTVGDLERARKKLRKK